LTIARGPFTSVPSAIDCGVTPPAGNYVSACATASGSPCVLPSVTGVLKLTHGSSPPAAAVGA
jgi:hypothetical protein